MNLNPFKVNAGVDTKVNISPNKSQIFVFCSVILAAIFAIISCAFAWFEKSGLWLPIVFFFTFILSALIGYLLTYRSADLAGSQPIELNSSQNGMSVKIDPALLAHPKDYIKILELMDKTKPLPVPAGMVDDKGVVIENSSKEAAMVVQKANSSIEPILRENFENLKSGVLKPEENGFFPEPSQEVQVTNDIASNNFIILSENEAGPIPDRS